MSWLTPLGFLGLLGIVALIIIYLLKPNYQKKMVSSTFVWKLSLKYRKKKIPISKFRNLLILICQILIISLCAFLLAQPVIKSNDASLRTEKIAIIDASASMLATYEDETRFERAVAEVKKLVTEVEEMDGVLTVIIAGKEASVLTSRATAENFPRLRTELDSLVDPDEFQCTYGVADVEGAMALAQNLMEDNPDIELLYYTGTDYVDKGIVTVKDVSMEGEWNASILDCREILGENYYTFSVDVASYGQNGNVTVYCDVYGANEEGRTVSMSMPVRCDSDKVQTVDFNTTNFDIPVYSYDYVYVHLEEDDSFTYDNSFYLYGGKKQTVRVQYCSSVPNAFVSGTLMGMRDTLRTRWDIELTEIRLDPESKTPPEFTTAGFDFYIFEHMMPKELPVDGAVLLINPDSAPLGAEITLGAAQKGDFTLAPGETHAVTNYVAPENIGLTEYRRVVNHADSYTPLAFCGGDPVLLVRNDINIKTAVMAFSLNKANLAVEVSFPVLMYNLFNYFMPSTLTDFVVDVDETIALNARSAELRLSGPIESELLTTFPTKLSFSVPGIYTLSQIPLSGIEVIESFYVKIATEECNIVRTVDELANPYIQRQAEDLDIDLLIYFASALVALLFIEWWLQSHDAL